MSTTTRGRTLGVGTLSSNTTGGSRCRRVAVATDSTAGDVAFWMLCQLHQAGSLSHADALVGIERQFGSRFVHENALGNPVIDPAVLAAFRRIRPAVVMWDGFAKIWRPYLP